MRGTFFENLSKIIAVLASCLVALVMGCVVPPNDASQSDSADDSSSAFSINPDEFAENMDIESAFNDELTSRVPKEWPIIDVEAMEIAMQGLDESIYTATSTIDGPMDVSGITIHAYEVTVNGGDHLVLRYVNAVSGELLETSDAWHAIPAIDMELPEGAYGAYYTSCPAGWPLCIRDPDSITFYSQNDPTWKYDTLGFGPDTIGQSGCVITAYAMMLRENDRGTRNPRDLNNLGKEYRNDGYGYCFSGANVKHACIASRAGAALSTLNVNDVWSKLGSGYAVTAYGYSTCYGSNHAQMLWGHDGYRYWTKDPWYDWTSQDQSMCLNSPTYRLMK